MLRLFQQLCLLLMAGLLSGVACKQEPAPAAAATQTDTAVTADAPVATATADSTAAADASAGPCTMADRACQLLRATAVLAADKPSVARFIAHLHGPYSKDACDGHGLIGGKPDVPCLASLRHGLCGSGLDVAFLTDHPTHMKDFVFPMLLYNDVTDTLLKDGLGKPYANVLHCPTADGVAAHDVTLLVGYEGEHTMPIGLHDHLSAKELYKVVLDNSTPFSEAEKVVKEVHARGGLVALVHAEQKAVSPERVRDLGVDVMEIYNIHANFILSYLIDMTRLFEFDPFMRPLAEAAHPDLAILPALTHMPDEGLNQWHQVLRLKRIAGLLGSDAHENVEIPQLCGGEGYPLQLECDKRAKSAPAAVAAFAKGGQITLADGKRFDNYRRLLRWYSSRAILQASDTKALHDRVQTAVAKGNSYHVWNVLGEPDAVQLMAVGVDEMGEVVVATQGAALPVKVVKAGRMLVFRLPTAIAEPWSPFTTADAKDAAREVKLWHIAPSGATVLATWNGKDHKGLEVEGDIAWLMDPPAGRYHLEVRVKPTYLAPALKLAAALAEQSYRWVLSGVVEVP
ncbi:MAG: hypothetical protein EXR77_08915 [Myxococcales bacterium]|nr:hypothetical protein [Myxococcales bacterium]